jgi:hypothetical protein
MQQGRKDMLLVQKVHPFMYQSKIYLQSSSCVPVEAL